MTTLREPKEKLARPHWQTKDVRGFFAIQPAYLKVGNEVLYVPDHVATIHDVREGGVERGFITMVAPNKKLAWCRFFLPDSWELRTKESSEQRKVEDLCWWIMLGRERVYEIMRELGLRIPTG